MKNQLILLPWNCNYDQNNKDCNPRWVDVLFNINQSNGSLCHVHLKWSSNATFLLLIISCFYALISRIKGSDLTRDKSQRVVNMHSLYVCIWTCALFYPVLSSKSWSILGQSRNKIDFVSYSPLQRAQLVQAVESLMSIYVHRETKVNYYKNIKSDIDPIPRVQAIKEMASTMSDKDLHYAFADLFLSLRDYHTNYFLPLPHRCLIAYSPLQLEFVDSDDNVVRPKVVLKSINSYLLSLQPEPKPYVSQLEVGDLLLTIDANSFKEYYEANQFKTGGANVYGGMRSALNSLYYHNGLMYPMPTNDTMTLEFLKPSGLTYQVTISWILGSEDSCMKSYNDYLSFPQKLSFRPPVSTRKRPPLLEHPFIHDITSVFPKQDESVSLHYTSDPIVRWGIYKPNTVNLGVIYLDSFMPLDGDIFALFGLIQSLLVNQLSETKAVVFDIRDNGGGSIVMADILFWLRWIGLASSVCSSQGGRQVHTPALV